MHERLSERLTFSSDLRPSLFRLPPLAEDTYPFTGVSLAGADIALTYISMYHIYSGASQRAGKNWAKVLTKLKLA